MCVYMNVCHMSAGAFEGQKRTPDALELEPQAITGAGNHTASLARSASSLSC